jgi:hypothetical protein
VSFISDVITNYTHSCFFFNDRKKQKTTKTTKGKTTTTTTSATTPSTSTAKKESPPSTSTKGSSDKSSKYEDEDGEDSKSFTDLSDAVKVAGVDVGKEVLLNGEFLVGKAYESETEEPSFLNLSTLRRRVGTKAVRNGLKDVNKDVYQYISYAAQKHLRDIIERLVKASKMRDDTQKQEFPIVITSDFRKQIHSLDTRRQVRKFEIDQPE